MTTPKVHVHNIQTGEEYDRDMTPEEIAELLEAPVVEETPVADDLVEGEQL